MGPNGQDEANYIQADYNLYLPKDFREMEAYAHKYFLEEMPKPPHDRTYNCHDVNTGRRLGFIDGYRKAQSKIQELQILLNGTEAAALTYRKGCIYEHSQLLAEIGRLKEENEKLKKD